MFSWLATGVLTAFACTEEFIAGLTGLEYLQYCWVLNPGLQSRNPACEKMSDAVMSQFVISFDVPLPPVCAQCPEACAAASLYQVAFFESGPVYECTGTFFQIMYALELLKNFGTNARAQQLIQWMHVNDYYNKRKEWCAQLREEEVASRWFADFVDAHAEMEYFKSSRGYNRTAILIAVGNAKEVLSKYQPMINIWRCYALRHNAELIVDTDDAVIVQHYRSPNWMRWFSAKKYLPYYDSLLVIDPDQYVTPECWDLNIFRVLRARATRIHASVVVREVFYPQTLNDGVAFIRNTPMSHFFLRLLLDKAAWWQTQSHDQSAFDETLLEMAGMEAAWQSQSKRPLYTEDCFPLIFPLHDFSHSVALHAVCWYHWMDALMGKGGARQSRHVYWMDPRVMDINQVVGIHQLDPNALIYHFAGRGKTFSNILRAFGLAGREMTETCADVYAFVDSKSQQVPCRPFNEGVINASSYCPLSLTIC